MTRAWIGLCFVASLMGACAEGQDALTSVEGTPLAQGMLAFLNDSTTTEAVLDVDVALDGRAARALIAHRDGPDGVLGTDDDDLFDTLAEVDAQYYVGASALAQIEAFAWDHGWVQDIDVVGTWHGVGFSADEADAVVTLVNTASRRELDEVVGLKPRTAHLIVKARPIQDLEDLAGVRTVGGTDLARLKDAVARGDLSETLACGDMGWHHERIMGGQRDAWRHEVPEALEHAVDDLLATQDWCGEAYGAPWLREMTVVRYGCEVRGYTVGMAQMRDAYDDGLHLIDFELDAAFDIHSAVCER